MKIWYNISVIKIYIQEGKTMKKIIEFFKGDRVFPIDEKMNLLEEVIFNHRYDRDIDMMVRDGISLEAISFGVLLVIIILLTL